MELVNYHHDVLNHSNQCEFFEGHKTMIHELTEWLRAQTFDGEPPGLPFGRFPYWDPGLPLAEPFGKSAAVAYEIMEEYPMCSHFRKRVGVPEAYFLFGAPSPEIEHRWPCDPAFDFHRFLLDWHGDTHIRTGGAMGIHTLTPTTPAFWVFHTRLDALYDDWNNCP